jgi:hypothetical protein
MQLKIVEWFSEHFQSVMDEVKVRKLRYKIYDD